MEKQVEYATENTGSKQNLGDDTLLSCVWIATSAHDIYQSQVCITAAWR